MGRRDWEDRNGRCRSKGFEMGNWGEERGGGWGMKEAAEQVT